MSRRFKKLLDCNRRYCRCLCRDDNNAIKCCEGGHERKSYIKNATTATTSLDDTENSNLAKNVNNDVYDTASYPPDNENNSNNIDTAQWMSKLSDDTILGSIVLPGSHDAGMSEAHNVLPVIGKSKVVQLTQTQDLSIYDQLIAGSRYFDLRINLSLQSQKLVTFHRNSHHFGMDGQSLSKIFDQLRQFLQSTTTETCIVKFSHTGSGRNGGEGSSIDVKAKVDIFLNQYQELLYVPTEVDVRSPSCTSGTCNLMELPIQSLRGKVVVVMDYDEYINPSKGRFRYCDLTNHNSKFESNLTVYDHYSNTDSVSKMETDQIQKWKKYDSVVKQRQRNRNDGNNNMAFSTNPSSTDFMFLLSWTLTPQGMLSPSVRRLAQNANVELAKTLHHNRIQNQWKPPNVVYVDYISNEICQTIIQYNFIENFVDKQMTVFRQ